MKTFRTLGAALLALGIGTATAAAVTPLPATPPPSIEADSLVTEVQRDCHRDVRRHYLPQYDRRVAHRHRQSDCRVILADREDDRRPRDCHRDVRRHYLPEYGRSVYHRHVGERCRVRVYNRHQGGNRPGAGNCVTVGPLTLCEGRD